MYLYCGNKDNSDEDDDYANITSNMGRETEQKTKPHSTPVIKGLGSSLVTSIFHFPQKDEEGKRRHHLRKYC